MLQHPDFDRAHAQHRRQQLLREAHMARLVHMLQRHRPSPLQRLLLALGDWMIRSGTRLKARYQAPVYTPDLETVNGH